MNIDNLEKLNKLFHSMEAYMNNPDTSVVILSKNEIAQLLECKGKIEEIIKYMEKKNVKEND